MRFVKRLGGEERDEDIQSGFVAASGTGGMCIGRCAAAEPTMRLLVRLQLDISPFLRSPPSIALMCNQLDSSEWGCMAADGGEEKTPLLEWLVTSNLRVEVIRTCNGFGKGVGGGC